MERGSKERLNGESMIEEKGLKKKKRKNDMRGRKILETGFTKGGGIAARGETNALKGGAKGASRGGKLQTTVLKASWKKEKIHLEKDKENNYSLKGGGGGPFASRGAA